MSTDLVPAGTYDLASITDTAASWREELGDDFVPEFPRIKVPAGGSTTWEDDEGTPFKELAGVIVGFKKATRLYLSEMDDASGGSDPDAWSNDGKIQIVPADTITKCEQLGLPVPLTNLAQCPYYQWDSVSLLGKTGKGKATRETREVYVLLEGSVIPTQITVPATSLRAFDKHAQTMVMKLGSLSAAETIFSLEAQGSGQQRYSTIVFKRGNSLDPETAKQAKAFARALKSLITNDPFAGNDLADAQAVVNGSAYQEVEAQVVENDPEPEAAPEPVASGVADDIEF